MTPLSPWEFYEWFPGEDAVAFIERKVRPRLFPLAADKPVRAAKPQVAGGPERPRTLAPGTVPTDPSSSASRASTGLAPDRQWPEAAYFRGHMRLRRGSVPSTS